MVILKTKHGGEVLNKLTVFSFFLALFFVTVPVSAQRGGDIVPGEIIVQMEPTKSAEALTSIFQNYDLKVIQLLSRRMNIWLLGYDVSRASNYDVLYSLRQHPDVRIVQENHYIDQRDNKNFRDRNPEEAIKIDLQQRNTTPNDPRYPEQWHLNNTGQGGGTPDADIDAPEAWDFTTGGVTALGDTIVVAVLDGGAQMNHPDLDFWVNRHEIPNNGIDDDGNGYVDDYFGWNAYNNNGNLPSDTHGTHVSGIVAAKGNNALGVSGVNWNTKVMMVAASSGTESVVVAGYSFVLEHRATYNETNGAKGAFVVATNASFGVDYGNPTNYPIWCAIYDSLGKYGVLSCGATANLGINVDLQGDIPTTCPSNWLVAVTNTTNTDAKNSGAGYGPINIDLGAPGTSILSTYTSSSYTTLTGTSMATPNVAGAIALMISAANPTLLQAYRTNPGNTALLFKQYLLEATDPNTALAGKTVSGGRLNVYNAVLAVGVPPDTVPPTPIGDLAVTESTSNSLKLTWTAPLDTSRNGVINYLIRKSASPILTLNDFDNATPVPYQGSPQPAGQPENFTITGLQPATSFYFAIRAQDRWGNTSAISNSPMGTTLQPPTLALSTHNLVKTVLSGTTETDSIIVLNSSASPSTLSYSVEMMNNTFPEGSIGFSLAGIGNNSTRNHDLTNDKEKPEILFGYAIEGQGGPDAGGYTWIDSREPNGPTFEWNDISTTGTELTNWTPTGTFGAKDEGYATVNLDFNFKFYGQQSNTVYVVSNGFVTTIAPTANTYSNAAIPNSSAPNSLIAPMWDDLDGTSGGQAFYQNFPDKTIIQYKNWKTYAGASSSLNFQVVLYRSGKIRYYYQNMSGTLNSATVGIENQTGAVGLGVAYNSTFIQNNLAVELKAEPDWLFPTNLSGLLYNGNSAAINLVMNSQGLPLGTYSMDLVVTSNDLLKPVDTVKVVMVNSTEIPVELVSLSAEAKGNVVQINWATATETNNYGFEIERKTATSQWEKIGFVKGAGTTSERTNYQFTDKSAAMGKYLYRLKQVDHDGTTTFSQEIEVDMALPTDYVLEQNFPNPFNPNTIIRFAIPFTGNVTLKVYNALGETVKTLIDETKEAGYYEVPFNAADLPSGLYLYELKSGNFSSVKKMLMMK
ncbi:MAG: hypothetical protein B6D45_01000 [Ignavibacteriales bacterium UTCHB3]|nr:MAG: hypothetical protein B6D45_01000 [Ignavibacteriales bacterium UTCHB3]